MTLDEKLTLDEFIIFAKTTIKNTAPQPSNEFIDKVTEIYNRKKKEEFKNPLSKEFTAHSNKIEYWIERGWIETDAEIKRLEKIESSSCSLISLIKKHGEIKGKEVFDEINNKKSNSLDGFIKRHGTVKGIKMYNSYKLQMSKQNTLIGMIERYGKEEGNKKYNSMISKKTQTLENHVKRYGKEEGTKRYLVSNKQRGKAHTFEGFIKKFGIDAEIKWLEFIKNRSERTSLNYYINKYGTVDGAEKYQKWIQSTICGKNSFSQSQISKTMFEKLDVASKALFGDNEIIIELNESEQKELQKKFIRPDFICGNKIIEFYGTWWHCHPSIFTKDKINQKIGKTALEVWEYDEKRVKILVSKGYEILIIWEHDYQENMELVIK